MQKYNAAPVAVNPSSATAPAKSLKSFLKPQENERAGELPMYNNRQLGQSLSESEASKIGLDTFHLTLSTTFAEISPHFVATVSAKANSDGTFESDPCILWTDTVGRPVYGQKAFINTDDYTLTIQPCGSYTNVLIAASARAFAESNVDLMDEERFRYVTLRIQDELAERGLKCDLFNEAHFHRMDISRNLQLNHGCSAYIGLFRPYSCAGRSKFRPIIHDDSTFDLRSKAVQLSLYDKGKEQAQKASKTRRVIPASNTMRGEVRFMQSKEIGKRFGAVKLRPSALLKSGRFSDLPEIYCGAWESTLFEEERPPREAMLMSNNVAEQWDEIRGRVAEMEPVDSREYERLLICAMNVGAYGIDGARRVFVEGQADSQTEAAKKARWRFEKRLRRVAVIFGAVVDESSGLMRNELWTEIKSKVTAR
jgi:hypothetical protein